MAERSSDSYQFALDHSSGQNAAAQRSDELAQMQAGHLQQMMKDPIGALGTADRIRQLQGYLNAYRGGYQLPDQVVVPHSRMASEQIATSSSTSND